MKHDTLIEGNEKNAVCKNHDQITNNNQKLFLPNVYNNKFVRSMGIK